MERGSLVRTQTNAGDHRFRQACHEDHRIIDVVKLQITRELPLHIRQDPKAHCLCLQEIQHPRAETNGAQHCLESNDEREGFCRHTG